MWLYINSHKLVLTYSGMVWTNVYSPYIRHWQQTKGMISPHRSDTDNRPKECLHPSSLMNQGVNWVLRGWLGGYLHDSGWPLNSCIPEESYLSMDTGFLKAIMMECPLQLTLCLLCALAPKTTWIWDNTAWNLKEVLTRGVGVSDEGLITFPMPPSETEINRHGLSESLLQVVMLILRKMSIMPRGQHSGTQRIHVILGFLHIT